MMNHTFRATPRRRLLVPCLGLLALLGLAGAPARAQGDDASARPPQIDRAGLFVTALLDGHAPLAETFLVEYVRRDWTRERLAAFAADSRAARGPLRSLGPATSARTAEGYFVVTYLAFFERDAADLLVFFEDLRPDAPVTRFEVAPTRRTPEEVEAARAATLAPGPGESPVAGLTDAPPPGASDAAAPAAPDAPAAPPAAAPLSLLPPAPWSYLEGPYEGTKGLAEATLPARLADGTEIEVRALYLARLASEGPLPVVVLLGTPGLADPDGAVGPNRPLRNLAGGLAGMGIAAVRVAVTSRGALAPAADDPVGADPDAAAAWLAQVADATSAALAEAGILAPGELFLAAHGATARLLPEVAARMAARPAGLVMLSPPHRADPRDVRLVLARVARDEEAAPAGRAVADRLLAELDAFLAAAPAGDVAALVDPATLRLVELRPAAPSLPAAVAGLPMLILHGSRDTLMAAEDRASWRAALPDAATVAATSYGTLDHLLIATGASPAPDDVHRQGFVAPMVVEDVAAWVAARAGRAAAPSLDLAPPDEPAPVPLPAATAEEREDLLRFFAAPAEAEEDDPELMKFFVGAGDAPTDLPASVVIIEASPTPAP